MPLLLLLLVTPLVVGLMRINELFLLRLQAGKLKLVRGRIPPQLLGDLGDVLRHAALDESARAELQLRGVVEDGRARLYASGAELSAAVKQRLRNTISLWPVAKIRQSSRRA